MSYLFVSETDGGVSSKADGEGETMGGRAS